MRVSEYSETKTALGGATTIGFAAACNTEEAEALLRRLWLDVFSFEKRFSRFLPSSELSMLNRRAGVATSISTEFERLLRMTQRLAQLTHGLFNPFVLPALQQAGYVRSAIPTYASDETDDYSRRIGVTPDKLEVSDGMAKIPHATALDMGGCGKGYLADMLGETLRSAGVAGYWLELSGDVATYGVDASGKPIHVAVDGTDYVVRCPKQPYGVATSGTSQRKGQQLKGHHIIDPRTFQPAVTDMVRATVCAPSAVDADVLASCAIITGSRDAARFLQSAGATAWLLQYHDRKGTVRTIVHGANIMQAREAVHA